MTLLLFIFSGRSAPERNSLLVQVLFAISECFIMFHLFLLQKCLLVFLKALNETQNVFIIIIKIIIIIIIIIHSSNLYQGCHTGKTASIGNRTHAHAPGSPEHREPRGPSCSYVNDVFLFLSSRLAGGVNYPV